MKVWVIVRASSGEDTALGYLPSGDVLGAFEQYQDGKNYLDKKIKEELEYGDEDTFDVEIISEEEVIIINKDDDYAVNLKLECIVCNKEL